MPTHVTALLEGKRFSFGMLKLYLVIPLSQILVIELTIDGRRLNPSMPQQ